MKYMLLALSCIILGYCATTRADALPKGLMLNLDIQNTYQGLIPNKAFFPLHVPQGTLSIQELLGENMLVFLPGEGLDIPHSSLIQPDGSEWIVTLQFGAYPEGGDGLVMSQCNDDFGYAIYLKDGAPHAVVRTGNCSMVLKEDRNSGVTDARRVLCTLELRIKHDMALLTINRKRASVITLDAPLTGTAPMPIRLGSHDRLPVILENVPGDIAPSGFWGAISGLKIWRQ